MVSGNIPLHKDRGLDPHMTYCTRCKGDAEELTIGHVKEVTFPDGKVAYYNVGNLTKLIDDIKRNGGPDYGRYGHQTRDVEEREKLPASQPCNKCKEEMKAHMKLVAEGGVYWKCKMCSYEGIVKPGTELAKHVRKEMKIEPPKPCGLMFQKCDEHPGINEHPMHSGRKDKEVDK